MGRRRGDGLRGGGRRGGSLEGELHPGDLAGAEEAGDRPALEEARDVNVAHWHALGHGRFRRDRRPASGDLDLIARVDAHGGGVLLADLDAVVAVEFLGLGMAD